MAQCLSFYSTSSDFHEEAGLRQAESGKDDNKEVSVGTSGEAAVI